MKCARVRCERVQVGVGRWHLPICQKHIKRAGEGGTEKYSGNACTRRGEGERYTFTSKTKRLERLIQKCRQKKAKTF